MNFAPVYDRDRVKPDTAGVVIGSRRDGGCGPRLTLLRQHWVPARSVSTGKDFRRLTLRADPDPDDVTLHVLLHGVVITLFRQEWLSRLITGFLDTKCYRLSGYKRTSQLASRRLPSDVLKSNRDATSKTVTEDNCLQHD